MGFTARENQDGAKSKDKQGFPKVPKDQEFADDLGYVTKAPKPAKKK